MAKVILPEKSSVCILSSLAERIVILMMELVMLLPQVIRNVQQKILLAYTAQKCYTPGTVKHVSLLNRGYGVFR